MESEPGYRALIGDLRERALAYLRMLVRLGREEVGEILRANLRAAAWFAAALLFVLLLPIAFVMLVIALIALVLPLWASALLTMLLFALAAAALGYIGYRKLELHGPDRTIAQAKETMAWLKARLRKPSASS